MTSAPTLNSPLAELHTWLWAAEEASFLAGQAGDGDPSPELPPHSPAHPQVKERKSPPTPRYRITALERVAVLRGIYWRSKGDKKAWRLITERLCSDRVSADFRTIVACLIEANVLHANGKVPVALPIAEAKERVRFYDRILKIHFPLDSTAAAMPSKRTERAYELVALDLCLEEWGLSSVSEVGDRVAFGEAVGKMAIKVKTAVIRKGGNRSLGSKRPSATAKIEREVTFAELVDPSDL